MTTKKKIVLVISLYLILITLVYINYINSLLDQIDRTDQAFISSEIGISEKVEKNLGKFTGEVINIALFGIDTETGDRGRSDTIMIVSIHKSQNKLKLASIMRDSYVTISGHGKDKINHAYFFGGPKLAMKTLNENFNLNITKYITLNFTDLSTVIDKLGGIEVQVTDSESTQIPGLEQGGSYVLTGDQALAFSRIRCLEGGDYERTARQRILMEKLFAMFVSRPIIQNTAMVDDLLPLIKTNLSKSEIISLCTYLAVSEPELEHTRFPKDEVSSDTYINGIYYLVFQENETVDAIYNFIFISES